MAKTVVVDRDAKRETPFLRGILIRRLQDSGLSFEDAYALASEVRHELRDVHRIEREALSQLVARRLAARFGPEASERFQRDTHALATLMVRHDDGNLLPFSRSQLRRTLEASGLDFDDTLSVVAEVHDSLMRGGRDRVDVGEVGRLTYEQLSATLGPDAARRFLAWTSFQQTDRPLLLLVGGVPGGGKSTIASEVAHRLEVVRIQSTDMLREVMRMMLPERLLPALHTSSFLAWRTLPGREGERRKPEQLLAEGFLAQASLLNPACEGAIHRALRERVSLILEGVHVHPNVKDLVPPDTDAIVVPIMLTVPRRSILRQRLLGRGRSVAGRRAERYLEHFDEIWALQTFLIAEAERLGVPVIANSDKETVTRHIILAIGDVLLREFDARPEDVFAPLPPPADR